MLTATASESTAVDRIRVGLEHRFFDSYGPGWEGVYFGVNAEGWMAALPRPLHSPHQGINTSRLAPQLHCPDREKSTPTELPAVGRRSHVDLTQSADVLFLSQ